MKIAGLEINDTINGEGICVSLWMQGCPFHCKGCQNPETWDFNGGYEISEIELYEKILKGLSANGIQRNFSILGGEPLCEENLEYTYRIIRKVKKFYPNIKIFIWTGYTFSSLTKKNNLVVNYILNTIDVLIDGQFILEQRDINLKLRGSKNQKIHYLKN